MMKNSSIVLELIKKAGSINKLAAALEVTRQTIQNWKKRGLPDNNDTINHIVTVTGVSKRRLKPEWYQ